VIRRFRPDVVLLRWSGTPADGHGHHQASAILAREAIAAAADASRFPEQLRFVEPWKVQRVAQSVGGFRSGPITNTQGLIPMETGAFDPVLGRSYSELGAVVRSLHRSQGQGSAERKGSAMSYARNISGETNLKDMFEGLDVTWKRLPGGEEIGRLLDRAANEYRADKPSAILPLLSEAREKLSKIMGVDARRRLQELDEAIAQVTGLWVEVATPRATALPGSSIERQITVLNRANVPMQLTGVGGKPVPPSELPYNTPVTQTQTLVTRPDPLQSQPYWLRDPPQGTLYTVKDQELRGVPEPLPGEEDRVSVRVNGTEISVVRPVRNRYVDEVYGEMTRPFIVEPAVTLRIADNPVLFPTGAAKRVTVELHANADGQAGVVRLAAPKGWSADPAEQKYSLTKAGEITTAWFQLTPPAAAARVEIVAVARTSGGTEISSAKTVISYPHIPQQTVFEAAASMGVRADVKVTATRIGYIMGAGDEIPEALRQMGCEVMLLGSGDLAEGDLSRFDAIITGVRAFNVRPDLRSVSRRLLDYVNAGGTLVVQYNTRDAAGSADAPYPITFSNGRVTVEDAPVTILSGGNPILHQPNEITAADFAGWVQERGLYFAATWDPKYTALFEMSDPGEKPLRGSTLVAKYGKGVYVFTALAFFRQLPAGVPGAYRLFANLVSAGKTLR
jgi:hypothetical protein